MFGELDVKVVGINTRDGGQVEVMGLGLGGKH